MSPQIWSVQLLNSGDTALWVYTARNPMQLCHGNNGHLQQRIHCSRNQPQIACPASWCAVISSSWDWWVCFLSKPQLRSIASAIAHVHCYFSFTDPANQRRFITYVGNISAPAKPGVCSASLWISSVSEALIGFRWRWKFARPFTSGRSMNLAIRNGPTQRCSLIRRDDWLLQNLPVSPQNHPFPPTTGSSNVSRSSLPTIAITSTCTASSVNFIKYDTGLSLSCLFEQITHGWHPTYKQLHEIGTADAEKGTCTSPAIAFASNVLPIRRKFTNNTPFGILPQVLYIFWIFRKSTISITSLCLINPATSWKVTFTLVPSKAGLLIFRVENTATAGDPAPPPVHFTHQRYPQPN